MFGALPGHPQPAEGHPNGFVADQPRGEALGKTDFGGQCQRPETRGLAKRPWTLVQQRPEGLAGASVEDRGRGTWSGRLGLQRREATLVERMQRVAHRLIGAAQVVRNGRGGLLLGTGEEDLATAYGKGGRGPEPGL
jgi:hypothetical protein